VDVVYLDFRKAFGTICHNILKGKLRKCGLDEWTVMWIENTFTDKTGKSPLVLWWEVKRLRRAVHHGTEQRVS